MFYIYQITWTKQGGSAEDKSRRKQPQGDYSHAASSHHVKILPVSLDLGNTEVPASTPSAPNTSTTWTTHQDNKRSRKENTISSFPVWNCRNSNCVTGRFGAKRREALGNTASLLKQGNCWNESMPNIPGIRGTWNLLQDTRKTQQRRQGNRWGTQLSRI